MEGALILVIVILGIVCLYQYGKRLQIESLHDTRTSELEAVLRTIGAAGKTGNLNAVRPTDKLVRAIFAEYLKIYLEKRLKPRIADLCERSNRYQIRFEQPEVKVFDGLSKNVIIGETRKKIIVKSMYK